MKKFLVILMIIVSPAVFGQENSEKPDLFSSQELDKLWAVWTDAKKEGLVLYMTLAKAVNFDESFIQDFADECLAMDKGAFYNFVNNKGIIPNLGFLLQWLLIGVMFSEIPDSQKIEGLKILYEYCSSEREAPCIAIDIRRISDYDSIF